MTTLTAIKASLDIVEVAGKYTDLKVRGREIKGLCPLHNERTPSFSIQADRQRFICFGCGERGDVIDLITKVEGISVSDLISRYNLEPLRIVKQPVRPLQVRTEPAKVVCLDDVVRTIKDCLNSPLLQYWSQYYPEQHLQAVAREYYLGHEQGSTLFWQSDLSGQVMNAKTQAYLPTGKRTGEPKHKYTAKDGYKASGCFGLHLIDKYPAKVVCLVEGEKNAIVGAFCFPEYIWIATGAASKVLPQDAIDRLQSRTVYLWRDNDTAGQNWQDRLKEQLPRAAILANRFSQDSKGWDIADEIEYRLNQVTTPEAPDSKPETILSLPTLSDYSTVIQQVEAFCSWYPLPDKPVRINDWTLVNDPKQFVSTHLEAARNLASSQAGLPYLSRLIELMRAL